MLYIITPYIVYKTSVAYKRTGYIYFYVLSIPDQPSISQTTLPPTKPGTTLKETTSTSNPLTTTTIHEVSPNLGQDLIGELIFLVIHKECRYVFCFSSFIANYFYSL